MTMPKKTEQTTDDLLRDLMIVQLGLAGIGQHQIREIVGVDIYRVNRIVKHFKKAKKANL
jgi:transposase-like protein